MKTIFPIGGNINKKNPAVLREFVRRAGGDQARIAILPQASALEDTGPYYTQLFMDLGVAHAESLNFKSRAEAGAEGFSRAIQTATGVFIGGGAQLRLTTLIGGTPLEAALREALNRGTPISGTSAGAAVMPRVMAAYGKGGSTPRDKIAQFVPGLGLTDRFAIDQHFRQRDRLGRLLYVITTHPGLIGLGIDEDTAAIIEEDESVTVCGSGAVTVVDGSGISATDAAEIENGGPVAVANIRIHILTSGCTYNARTGEVNIPPKISLAE
jgi:cyanophycinase